MRSPTLLKGLIRCLMQVCCAEQVDAERSMPTCCAQVKSEEGGVLVHPLPLLGAEGVRAPPFCRGIVLQHQETPLMQRHPNCSVQVYDIWNSATLINLHHYKVHAHRWQMHCCHLCT